METPLSFVACTIDPRMNPSRGEPYWSLPSSNSRSRMLVQLCFKILALIQVAIQFLFIFFIIVSTQSLFSSSIHFFFLELGLFTWRFRFISSSILCVCRLRGWSMKGGFFDLLMHVTRNGTSIADGLA